MKLSSVAAILNALNNAEVRALVVGGLAVNAHGYLRFTNDADLVIELVPENIERTFRALAGLGYGPRIPITAEQFSDPAMRASWIRDKGMKVLQLVSESHMETPVDVFVIEPFDFDEEFSRAVCEPVTASGQPPVLARYVAVDTLIAMKEAVGRPKDLEDAKHLRWIQEEKEKGI
jgi:hypothetical protein